MMRLQRITVCCAERRGELVRGVLEVAADTLRSEIECTGFTLLVDIHNLSQDTKIRRTGQARAGLLLQCASWS